MPWEKAFNEDKALESAMVLFWEKGYSETSMANLLDVMNLTRGSFYNAFGSKKDVFVKVLQKYDRENRCDQLQALIEMDQPDAALEEFFAFITGDCAEGANKKGCFIINTCLEINSYDQDIQKIIKNSLSGIEVFFKQMIELGKFRGLFSEKIDAQISAKTLMSAVVAIRVLGRGVYDKNSLQVIYKQALQSLYA